MRRFVGGMALFVGIICWAWLITDMILEELDIVSFSHFEVCKVFLIGMLMFGISFNSWEK